MNAPVFPGKPSTGTAAKAGALTLMTLCTAMLIAQLDTSVVNLATKPIGAEFQAPVSALQWVIDGYNLTYAVLLLSGGLLADLYGRRRVFMAGAAIFATASMLSALATSVAILIAGRVACGIGATMMLPASLAILRVAWPEPKARARVLGVFTGCNGLAFIIGPTLGGLLIAHTGWRSVFFVVVPFALAALAAGPFALSESADPKDRHFDAGAQLLGILALGGLAMAAIESHDGFWALPALAMAVIAFLAFLRVERRRGSAALVPLDLFRIRAFRGAIIATAGMTFGMYGVLFLQLLAWQGSGRLDAVGAGLALLPMAVVFTLVSPFSGALQARFGTRFMTGGGVAIIGCGLLAVGAAAGSTALLGAEIGLMLTGLGMGLATGPLTGVAVGAVSAARSGTAAALLNVARMVGATLGVAVLGAVFALLQGGTEGLRPAMLLGGAVQILAAGACWRALSA
ncbi:MFS transporter [Dongia sp.]|uniref:MFS transporter n=1 Tax=Dongia sp. TaxID=1977262 RepID=UPI0037506E21